MDIEDDIESLTAEAHAARDRGDEAEARRLFEQRSAIPAADEDGESEAEGEEDDAGALELPTPSEARTNTLIQAMTAADPDAAAELQREWGSDTGSNIQYAAAVAERFVAEDRSLRALFETVVEDDSGHRMTIGDHPGLIKLAAKVGRLLKHGDPAQTPPPRQPKATRSTMPANTTSNDPEIQIAELTEQLHAALSRGDSLAAKRLDQQRSAITSRQHGGPIVGVAGRTA